MGNCTRAEGKREDPKNEGARRRAQYSERVNINKTQPVCVCVCVCVSIDRINSEKAGIARLDARYNLPFKITRARFEGNRFIRFYRDTFNLPRRYFYFQ